MVLGWAWRLVPLREGANVPPPMWVAQSIIYLDCNGVDYGSTEKDLVSAQQRIYLQSCRCRSHGEGLTRHCSNTIALSDVFSLWINLCSEWNYGLDILITLHSSKAAYSNLLGAHVAISCLTMLLLSGGEREFLCLSYCRMQSGCLT
jgi:hypothetical protein